jgi:hypothetical protein
MSNIPSGTGYEVDSTKGGLAFGISTLAGVLLTMVAVFQILQGIAAIANDTVFVRGLNYTYEFDVTSWGWIHVIVGLIGLGTGIGIIMGQTWGWLMGILVAGISTVSNFMYMPYYPFWSLTVIGVDILIIWALCTQIANDRLDTVSPPPSRQA